MCSSIPQWVHLGVIIRWGTSLRSHDHLFGDHRLKCGGGCRFPLLMLLLSLPQRRLVLMLLLLPLLLLVGNSNGVRYHLFGDIRLKCGNGCRFPSLILPLSSHSGGSMPLSFRRHEEVPVDAHTRDVGVR